VAPDARIRVLDAPPVLGAAVIGLERLGASPAARRRLRAGLTETQIAPKTAARAGTSRRRREEP
jgi:hypothetical protein